MIEEGPRTARPGHRGRGPRLRPARVALQGLKTDMYSILSRNILQYTTIYVILQHVNYNWVV